MKATFKVKLIGDPTPPPPPFVGTRLAINLTGEPVFTLYPCVLAAGSAGLTVGWGDGKTDVLAGGQPTEHVYPRAGTYEIRLSDDVEQLSGFDTQTDANRAALVGVTSNARKLKLLYSAFYHCANLAAVDFTQSCLETINYGAFNGCTALPSRLDFPSVVELTLRRTSVPFVGCTSVREIHFAAANEAALRSSPAYAYDPTLGTGVEGVCRFDL